MANNPLRSILETIREEVALSTLPDKNQQLVQIACGMALVNIDEKLQEIANILQSIHKSLQPDEQPEPVEEVTTPRTKGRRKRNGEPAGAEITS